MKKFFAIMLCLVMVVAMTACSSAEPAVEEPVEEAAPEVAEPVEEVAELAYPEKDITIVVPYDAGGGNDILARVLSAVAMEGGYFKGANVIVENQPGGGGAIGQTYVAQTAEPDGYTLLTFTGSTITNPILKDVTFTVEDFKIIVGCNPDPAVLVACNDTPYNTLEEFIEYAQANEVLITDSGFGTNSHIRGLGMNNVLTNNYNKALKLTAIHTDSSNMQLTQLMGGHADVSIMTAGECAEAINEGNVKALAVLSNTRSDSIPDVPTFLELGYEGVIDGADRCIACSANVPDDIYQYLVEEFGKLCASDEFVAAMNEANMTPAAKSPEEMNEYIANMTAKVTALKDYLLAGVD